jgi:hypothetical protein
MLAADETNPLWFGFAGGGHVLIRSLHVGDRFFAENCRPAVRAAFLDWAQAQGYTMLSVASHYLNRDASGRGRGWKTPDLYPLQAGEYRRVERMLDDLAARRIMVYPFGGFFSKGSDFPRKEEDQLRYIHYVLARLGPYWNILFNVAGPEPNLGKKQYLSADDVNRLGALIRRLDPFGHPISVHNRTGDDPYRDSAWSTYGTLQGPKTTDRRKLHAGLLRNHHPRKPLYAQETLWSGNKHHPAYSDEDLRKNAFVCCMAASAINFGDMAGNSSSGFGGSLDLADRAQHRHDIIKGVWDFFEEIPFYRMAPHQDLVNRGYCLADPGREYLVYLESRGTVNVELTGGPFRVTWINAQKTADRRPAEPTATGRNLTPPPDGDDWLLHLVSAKPLPAFPGAEGFGARTPGGRGGRVIKVTNLARRGPGSLQAAVSARGPRIVVFDVSGVIPGNVTIEHGRISVLGQTAPGAGITIAGSLSTRYNAREPINDVVVRFLRVRPPDARGAGGDAIQFSQNERVILDHVSCSWACDETVDIYSARDVTVQWCTIEESVVRGHPEGRHNYGLISGPRGERVSIHHTLFVHHARRCPAIANGPADIRNNVVYNFRDGLSHEGHPPNDRGFNLIANYYKRGPSDPKIFPFCFRGTVSYYLRDNYIHGIGLVQDPWAEADKLPGFRYYAKHGRKAPEEFSVAPVITHEPEKAYELVLARAGCFPRDTVTKRVIRETRAGTGSWGRPGGEDLMEGLTPADPPDDGDGDGMPDEWEKAHGLDPKDGADHVTRMPSGYTAVEEYANERAQRLIERGERDG